MTEATAWRPRLPKLGPHDFTKSQGEVDATGITPELRALLARQRAAKDDKAKRARRGRRRAD